MTIRAFEMADRYQIPVVILSDQYLADSLRDVPGLDPDGQQPPKYCIVADDSENFEDYYRYQITESGVSPRAIPSLIQGTVYADSDEHDQKGHITEDGDMRRIMTRKRLYLKEKGLLENVVKPLGWNLIEGNPVILAFGSTAGVLREAVVAFNLPVGLIHIPQVWPFPAAELVQLLEKQDALYTAELNATAQLAALIRSHTDLKVCGSLLKYNGRPFTIDELGAKIQKEVLGDD